MTIMLGRLFKGVLKVELRMSPEIFYYEDGQTGYSLLMTVTAWYILYILQ